MSGRPTERVLDAAGSAAPPRKNGELVFAAPWEGRVFGVTLALHEAGLFQWEEFRGRLIAKIARWEREHGDAGWSYYLCWLAAFEELLVAKGFCGPTEIDARELALAARPAGHDH